MRPDGFFSQATMAAMRENVDKRKALNLESNSKETSEDEMDKKAYERQKRLLKKEESEFKLFTRNLLKITSRTIQVQVNAQKKSKLLNKLAKIEADL